MSAAAKKIEISPALQAAISEAVEVAVTKALAKHTPEQAACDRVLRLPEVLKICGLSRSSIYALIDKGEFPGGFLIGPNARAWLQSDVQAWLQSRVTAAKDA